MAGGGRFHLVVVSLQRARRQPSTSSGVRLLVRWTQRRIAVQPPEAAIVRDRPARGVVPRVVVTIRSALDRRKDEDRVLRPHVHRIARHPLGHRSFFHTQRSNTWTRARPTTTIATRVTHCQNAESGPSSPGVTTPPLARPTRRRTVRRRP